MRILVVTQYFWPESFRVNEIVEYLTSRGHVVTVLTGKPNYPQGRSFPAFKAAPQDYRTYHGAEIVRVPMLLRGSSQLTLLLNYLSFAVSGLTVGAAKLAGRKIDVIFVCQLSPVTLALPALLQRRLKSAPVAMWILDLWPESLTAVRAVRSTWALHAISRLVRFIYRRCDRILVQSRAFIPIVADRSSIQGNISYYPAWTESTFEQDGAPPEPSPKVAAYRDTFNIMFAGNIGDAQDLPTVLKAASLLKHRAIRWLIVGDGRASSTVRSEIEALGLQDHVIMLGRHPIEEMPGFFAAADVLLVSLKDEPVFAMTIPGKVQSYMSAGKPIIAMLAGEGAAVITEAAAGMVTPPGNADALAKTVSNLADSPAEVRARMAENGIAYCRREFDRTKLFSELEQVLEQMLHTNPRP